MITTLNEINRVLLALRRLAKRRKKIPRGILTDFLRGEVILGQNPEFGPVLDFINHLGLIAIHRNGVSVTPLGLELLAGNAAELYELQPQQRVLLCRKCYFDGPLRPKMQELIKKFSPDPSSGKMMWSSVDSEPFGEIEWLSRHLIQLEVLNASQHLLIVTEHYRETIAQFLDEGGDFTEEQMEKNLREKRLLGNLAETFVSEFEKARLTKGGHKLESACVERISKHRVNAGYDIKSFDGASKNLNHDRFIEVKGSGKPTVYFFWTQNEIQKAQKLGDRYWIYFVGGIDKKTRLFTREPVMIQNPNVRLKTDSQFRVRSSNFLVEGNICGNLLSGQTKTKTNQ